jgi:hypothetical protein
VEFQSKFPDASDTVREKGANLASLNGGYGNSAKKGSVSQKMAFIGVWAF